MSDCAHCSTPFSATGPEDRFCCKGCEFVYDLIHDEGLDRYYTLRQDTPVKPVRSVPFEAHDFTWLIEKVAEIESAPGKAVEGDFSLDGISCIGCVWLVEKIFLRQPGALEAAAHPATGRVHLRWQPGVADLPAFARELVSFGYTLAPRRSGSAASEAGQLGARLGLCGAFMLNAMGFTLPSYLGMTEDFAFSGLFQLIGLLTATLSMLVGGSYFIGRAWQAARLKTLHIDLPIALGLIVAYIGSLAGWALEIHGLIYFDFVCTFVFLMLAGRYFQFATLEKNRQRLQRQRPVPEWMRSPDRSEPLALTDLAAGVRPDRFVFAHFSPAFEEMHRQLTPELAASPVSVGQSGSVVSLLTAMGGSGYVLEKSAAELVGLGRFQAVEDAPDLRQPVYAALHIRHRTHTLHRKLTQLVARHFPFQAPR